MNLIIARSGVLTMLFLETSRNERNSIKNFFILAKLGSSHENFCGSKLDGKHDEAHSQLSNEFSQSLKLLEKRKCKICNHFRRVVISFRAFQASNFFASQQKIEKFQIHTFYILLSSFSARFGFEFLYSSYSINIFQLLFSFNFLLFCCWELRAQRCLLARADFIS